MASATLEWNAAYGRLPFDLFVLPLYKRVIDASHKSELPWPTEDLIGRILAPHQTIQERNICADWNSVWLRTCYKPSLTQKYLELGREMNVRWMSDFVLDKPSLYGFDGSDCILDEPSLYGFEGSDQEVLDQLLLRLPGLTDAQGIMDEYGDGSVLLYGSLKNDPEAIEQIESFEDEGFKEICKVGLNVQNFVYVVDDEAVEKKFVKVWWFDEFGKIIWDNAMAPKSDLIRMLGPNLGRQTFEEMIGGCQRGDVIR